VARGELDLVELRNWRDPVASCPPANEPQKWSSSRPESQTSPQDPVVAPKVFASDAISH